MKKRSKVLYVYDARKNTSVFKTKRKKDAQAFLRGYRTATGSGRLEFKRLGKKDY